MNMDKVRETMLKDMNKEKQISKEMVPYTVGFEKQVVCCGKQSKCLEIKKTDDKKDHTDDDNIVLFRKRPSCIEMKMKEKILYKDYGDQKQDSNRNSLYREIDFRDGIEELIVNMQAVGMPHDDICDEMDHIQSEENCEMISSWYSVETPDKCSQTHNTLCKESINPSKSNIRIAQRMVYFITLLKAKSCTETDCEPDEVDSMVKVTCCQSMSAVPNKEWKEVKVVAISLRKTSKYMQNLHNALCFDELKSNQPNQRLSNLHNCHFIEEIKWERRRCGLIQILKRYRCEQTNRYMCVNQDGCIDSDDKGTVFITRPAKMKAFYTIQDKETSRRLSVQDKAKFVISKIKDIESLPDCFKMTITPVNCR